MKKALWILTAMVAGFFSFSCGGGSWPEGEKLLKGQWLLLSVQSGPDTFPMASRWITYRFSSSGNYSITESESALEKGQWSLSSKNLTLKRENGTLEQGEVKTLSEQELAVVFSATDNTITLKRIKASEE